MHGRMIKAVTPSSWRSRARSYVHLLQMLTTASAASHASVANKVGEQLLGQNIANNEGLGALVLASLGRESFKWVPPTRRERTW